jgi:hypothetical protein
MPRWLFYCIIPEIKCEYFIQKFNLFDRSEKLARQKDLGLEWYGLNTFPMFHHASVVFWRKKLRVIALPMRKSTSGALTFCASFEKLVKWQHSFWLETEIALDFCFLRTEHLGCPIYSCIKPIFLAFRTSIGLWFRMIWAYAPDVLQFVSWSPRQAMNWRLRPTIPLDQRIFHTALKPCPPLKRDRGRAEPAPNWELAPRI